MINCLEYDVKKRLDFNQIHTKINDICKSLNIRL